MLAWLSLALLVVRIARLDVVLSIPFEALATTCRIVLSFWIALLAFELLALWVVVAFGRPVSFPLTDSTIPVGIDLVDVKGMDNHRYGFSFNFVSIFPKGMSLTSSVQNRDEDAFLPTET